MDTNKIQSEIDKLNIEFAKPKKVKLLDRWEMRSNKKNFRKLRKCFGCS